MGKEYSFRRWFVKGDVVAQFPMYTRNYVQEGGGIQLGNPNPAAPDKEGEVRP